MLDYKVRYEDNTGCVSTNHYKSKEAAEAAIEEELEELKEYFRGRYYNYGEFTTDDGVATKIWEYDGDEYAIWVRQW